MLGSLLQRDAPPGPGSTADPYARQLLPGIDEVQQSGSTTRINSPALAYGDDQDVLSESLISGLLHPTEIIFGVGKQQIQVWYLVDATREGVLGTSTGKTDGGRYRMRRQIRDTLSQE